MQRERERKSERWIMCHQNRSTDFPIVPKNERGEFGIWHECIHTKWMNKYIFHPLKIKNSESGEKYSSCWNRVCLVHYFEQCINGVLHLVCRQMLYMLNCKQLWKCHFPNRSPFVIWWKINLHVWQLQHWSTFESTFIFYRVLNYKSFSLTKQNALVSPGQQFSMFSCDEKFIMLSTAHTHTINYGNDSSIAVVIKFSKNKRKNRRKIGQKYSECNEFTSKILVDTQKYKLNALCNAYKSEMLS